jgi:hypothetical protein
MALRMHGAVERPSEKTENSSERPPKHGSLKKEQIT